MTKIISKSVQLLRMTDIVKVFTGTVAVNGVDFICNKGEIHGVVGENGAGKSTLMKILGGIHLPNRGKIFINGEEKVFRNYSEARKAGVGIVYQELSLLPDLSIAENMYMGIWLKKNRLINWNEINSRSKKLLNKIGMDINPEELVSSISIAHRQMVEIGKVLTQNPKIIIFDEPTASLSKEEVNKLFEIIKNLKKSGKGIIFISHRLKEVLEISDVISVMKDGKKVITENVSFFDEEKIISYMVGRKIADIFPEKRKIEMDETMFSFKGILKEFHTSVAFSVSKGEVLGIGGLQGQGQIDFLRTIFGIGESEGNEVKIFDKELKIRNPFQAKKAGISLIPENRAEDGLFLTLNIIENLASATIDRRQRLGIIDKKEEYQVSEDVVRKLSLGIKSLSQTVQSLSGGNLQKIVLGKWLISKPRVIIMLEPTKGVDVATKQQIYILIRELSKNNDTAAIIIYTTDMLELIGICDRVLVMNRGFFTANLKGDEITEEKIMKAAVSDKDISETERE